MDRQTDNTDHYYSWPSHCGRPADKSHSRQHCTRTICYHRQCISSAGGKCIGELECLLKPHYVKSTSKLGQSRTVVGVGSLTWDDVVLNTNRWHNYNYYCVYYQYNGKSEPAQSTGWCSQHTGWSLVCSSWWYNWNPVKLSSLLYVYLLFCRANTSDVDCMWGIGLPLYTQIY